MRVFALERRVGSNARTSQRGRISHGAAAHAGLQIADEIEAVDGRSVTDLFGEALQAVITNRPPGTAAKLTISRGGATREIAVTVANQ